MNKLRQSQLGPALIDIKASADVYNVSQFQLPDPAGRAGGACTSALLQVLYKDKQSTDNNLTWVQLLRSMRTVLRGMGYDQIPQLTSSRLIDVNKPMYIVPPHAKGMKRAILIGINYKGQQGQLSGCHNDANNMGDYLERVHGFSKSNMLILMDDGVQHSPTKQNILNAFERITQYSQSGDVVFLHYSGT
jgi:metacaspase-1